MRGSREISLVPSLHRASTDALMMMNMMTRKCEIACKRFLAWQTGGR